MGKLSGRHIFDWLSSIKSFGLQRMGLFGVIPGQRSTGVQRRVGLDSADCLLVTSAEDEEETLGDVLRRLVLCQSLIYRY